MIRTAAVAIMLCVGLHSLAQENTERVTMKTGKKQVSEFQLVFSDEFNGDRLDEKKWHTAVGVFRDPEHRAEKQWYTSDNIEVSNGTLKLIAKREELKNQKFSVWIKDGMKPFSSDFEFTSAEIDSHEQFGYGMYEIRCKLPRGKGMWPAFWMYGESNGVNHEIDVFEFWNQKSPLRKFSPRKMSRVHNMTAHYKGGMTQENYKGPDYSEDFHIFSVVWSECKLDWYVDGELKRRITRFKKSRGEKLTCEEELEKYQGTNENVFPRGQKLNIIANLALQSGDAKPLEADEFPAALEIDYIRYYKFSEDAEQLSVPKK